MTDELQTDDATDVSNPYQIGDPVMDAAQGRAMLVLDAPDQIVAEWSDANGYDLEDNYANGKFDPDPSEPVVECVYVSDVRSEPSKTYTFPASRVVLIDAHHADGGRRVYDRVVSEVLERVFSAVIDNAGRQGAEITWVRETLEKEFDADTVDEARELADVEQTVVSDAAE